MSYFSLHFWNFSVVFCKILIVSDVRQDLKLQSFNLSLIIVTQKEKII